MRLTDQNNCCCPELLPQQRRQPLAVLAPWVQNHEAELHVQSSDKACTGNMIKLSSPRSNWSCIFLSLLGVFAILGVKSQDTFSAFYQSIRSVDAFPTARQMIYSSTSVTIQTGHSICSSVGSNKHRVCLVCKNKSTEQDNRSCFSNVKDSTAIPVNISVKLNAVSPSCNSGKARLLCSQLET